MANIIACNLGSYRGKFSKQETYEHLNKIGLTNVEISAPKTQEIDTEQEELDTYNINHPCVGINFDTANVHYHTNRKIDTVDEIQKILDYIRAVHLKDTMGGYHAWNFPALGEGIVNFKAVFELLNSRGFEGPFTMELEGIEGENIDRAGILNRVEDSFQYLKDLGVIH